LPSLDVKKLSTELAVFFIVLHPHARPFSLIERPLFSLFSTEGASSNFFVESLPSSFFLLLVYRSFPNGSLVILFYHLFPCVPG